MRSSIVTVRADSVPTGSGFVLATKPDLPLPANLDPAFPYARHVLHVEPGRDPSTVEGVVQVIVDGNQVNWNPAAVAALWPNGSKYVLEAEYLTEGELGPEHRRCKVIELADGVTPTATNLVPHSWAGDT